MITRTSLNEAFLDKVRQAAREAVKFGAAWTEPEQDHAKGVSYVSNRRGRRMMRVDYQYGRSPAFRFWEESRRDVTPLVTAALGGAL